MIPPPKKIGILLADDSEDDILLMRTALRKTKLLHILDAVEDGGAALAYLRRQGKYAGAQAPGLVVLDVNMPHVDGFAALKGIKADPALQHLPVVMLTTSQREEDVFRAYREGACTYIAKPAGFEELEAFAERFESYWARVARLPVSA